MKRRLQVFVSSTYVDLLSERQAAVSAILKAGHIPAGMELFTSGDRSQMETIKQWIDESDIYMLILGGRYGSLEPSSGVSYTELEYDYAVQQSKPIFAVVITEQALEARIKTGGSSYMEKENPKELALFRKKVLSNISSFFDDAKDIKLCIHESLADFAANRDLRGWVPADEIVDTRPLFEEIRKLSEENRQLKESLAELEKKTPTQVFRSDEPNNELSKLLKAIEVKIPANLADGKETKIDLLNLFYANKETFINGVTNAANASEAENFFFFSVCPKLQVHGLMVNERVAGARYRRYAVTKQGSALLAHIDRRVLLESDQASKAQLPAAESSKAIQAKESTATDAKPLPTKLSGTKKRPTSAGGA